MGTDAPRHLHMDRSALERMYRAYCTTRTQRDFVIAARQAVPYKLRDEVTPQLEQLWETFDVAEDQR